MPQEKPPILDCARTDLLTNRGNFRTTNQERSANIVDFRRRNTGGRLVPNTAIFSNSTWENLYLEFHQQPTFDTGEHQQTMHVIAHMLSCSSGERWLDCKIKREQRKVGDFAICPEGVTHRCNWDAPIQFMILAIEPVLLKEISQDCMSRDRIELVLHFVAEQDVLMHGILSTLTEEAKVNQPDDRLLIDSLKTALSIQLLRKYCTTKPQPFTYHGGLANTKLQQVTDYINDHLHQDLKLSDIAAILQISPYHFCRLFKRSTGISPHQYIIQCRVERAKQLLKRRQMNISEIALTCGFTHQSHLHRHFKRLTGVTPKAFVQHH
jgi:AraC family transcriptional regulator